MKRTPLKRAALLAVGSALMGFMGCAGCPGSVSGPVIYVNAGATGLRTGTDWANALTELQDALLVAAQSPGVSEIWVAAGTYRSTTTGDRTASFRLKNALAIYGGFAGTETAREQRDTAANPTILSGDLNADDDGGSNLVDNLYHVVIADQVDGSAVLDGFTIRGGYANEGNNISGAGMYCQNASPVVARCRFEANVAAVNGAGMLNQNSTPTVKNCVFAGNTALGSGGGMLNLNSSPVLTGCTFESNQANIGGALANQNGSQPTLTNCTFTGNTAAESAGAVANSGGAAQFIDCSFTSNSSAVGGAVQNANTAAPLFAGCTFTENGSQQDGGAMLNVIDVAAVLSRCTFRSNAAGRSGGAISNSSKSNAILMNCAFEGNSALTGGGGLFNLVSDPVVMNCTFSGNTGGVGGAMLNRDNAAPAVTNCTFSANQANLGGGIYNTLNASPVITNCVLWGNIDSGVSASNAQIRTDSGTPVVTYSCVQGGWEGDGGTGNIDTDPLFANAAGPDASAGTGDEDLSLQAGSPCIDSGNNLAVPADAADLDADENVAELTPLDAADEPRNADDPATDNTGTGTGAVVDMGAFEFQP